MSSTTTSYKYFSNPKINISIPTADLTYAIVTCKGNTVATSGNIISGNITGGLYTTPELSFNTLYTITITPYGTTGTAGTSQTLTIDTTPKLTGTKSAQKSTMVSTSVYASSTTDNFTISRAITSSDAAQDISTNIKTVSVPYYDTDLSGNSLYYYYIKQYNSAGDLIETTSPINSVYVNVRAPTDMSYSYFDSSAATISWTNAKNSYNTSYYNTVYAVPTAGVGASTGAVSVTPSNSATTYSLTGLKNSTTYSLYVQTYLLSAAAATVSATTATPAMSSISMTEASMNSIKLAWSSTYTDNFIVSRRVGTLDYSDISNVKTSTYSDTDISGNTTYYYYVTPRSGIFSGSASSTVSTTTAVAYPTDVSASFYDASAIRLTFTVPKNSYAYYVYYTGYAVYGGNTYSATSTTSPVLIQNLSGGTTYSCYINVVVDGYYTGVSSTLSVTTKTTYSYTSGLLFKIYSGYFNDSMTFFNTASLRSGTNTGYVTNLTNIYTGTNSTIAVNGADNYSVVWTGYFYTNSYSGNFTFYTNSDDSSLIWIGTYATSGYSTSNATVNNSGLHGMQERSGAVLLSSNTYYPIRIMFGENGGGDDCQVSFTLPGTSTRIYNGSGYYYS